MIAGYSKYNEYGGALYAYNNSEMNIYGGTITGTGTMQKGGLICVRTGSIANIYNANISGGTALEEGGNIYVLENSSLNIYGGVITNGKASAGGGIYLKKSTMTISGSPKIIGNAHNDVMLSEDKTITIGEGGLKPGTEIGIVLDAGTGVFAINASKEDAQYFTATKGKIVYNKNTKT